MDSLRCHRVSNTMTNRSKKSNNNALKVALLEKKLARMAVSRTKPLKQKRRSTPFADSGSIIGRAAGSMFGYGQLGSTVGRYLGSGIGQIMGSGDYQITGPPPEYNVLTAPAQIPQFSTTHSTNIICHREYLGDIAGTASFDNTLYPLNPGISSTFPWLSSVADNYQEYKFHGLVFEFRSLITDFVTSGAPGVVVMATNYNADVPEYATKQQMENSEFAVSVKPTNNLIHGIECSSKETTIPQRYVRTGTVPANQDLRLYDYGNFQFATQSNPLQNLGELWVSYCVEFFKPILKPDVVGSPMTGHTVRTAASNASPCGLIQQSLSGDIGLSSTGTFVSYNATPGAIYVITFNWTGVSTVGITGGVFNTTGGTAYPLFTDSGYGTNVEAAGVGTTSTSMMISYAFKCNLTSPGSILHNLSSGWVIPASSVVDILVSQLDSGITA